MLTKFVDVWCNKLCDMMLTPWFVTRKAQYQHMVNVKELDYFVMICVCIVTVIFCMYLWYCTKRWVSLQNRRNILPRIKEYINTFGSCVFFLLHLRSNNQFKKKRIWTQCLYLQLCFLSLVLGCNTVILFFRDFVHVRKSIPTFPYRKHHTVY